jgi:hypothetical protein
LMLAGATPNARWWIDCASPTVYGGPNAIIATPRGVSCNSSSTNCANLAPRRPSLHRTARHACGTNKCSKWRATWWSTHPTGTLSFQDGS